MPDSAAHGRRRRRALRSALCALLTGVVAISVAACGAGTVRSGDDGTTTTTAAPSTTSRLAPIIYRPAGLSMSQKVPLLIALHGSFGDPQAMEGLTHFEHVAEEHGFVVAYLASANLSHPWSSPSDLPYVNSMITQITAAENIDPSRVYVTGFSAGGAETWIAACSLSARVAAVAIVSDAMGSKTLKQCALAKPVSELLIVGTANGEIYSGIAGVLPSASQTTANWRGLDGCAPTPVQIQQVSTVTQQTWTSCTDGTSVGLYTIQGAGHVWPPYGTGAPQDYPTSEAVWSFLSAHSAAPLSFSASEASLLSLRVTRVRRSRTAVAKFRLHEPLTVAETIGPHLSRPVRKTFQDKHPSLAQLSLSIPTRVSAGSYNDVIALQDSYGRTRIYTESIRLPSLPPLPKPNPKPKHHA